MSHPNRKNDKMWLWGRNIPKSWAWGQALKNWKAYSMGKPGQKLSVIKNSSGRYIQAEREFENQNYYRSITLENHI